MRRRAVLIALSLLCVFVVQSQAMMEPVAPSDNVFVRVVEWPKDSTGPSFSIVQNNSELLRFDRQITRVAVSNPELCDVTMIGDRDVLVVSKKVGSVILLAWDQAGGIATFNIHSTVDVDRLREVLQNVDPSATLKIVPFNDTAAVYGEADTSLKLKQIAEAAKAFHEKSVTFLKLRETKQILLEVRFAEANRKATKEFKFDTETITKRNFFGTFAGKTGESSVTRITDSDHSFSAAGSVAYPLATLGTESVADIYTTYFSKSLGLQNFLKWLEQKNVLKFLARPNLVAKDGEEAKFVVGGEFPIPLASRDGVVVNYKEYGTQLKFLPEILDEGLMRLKVDSEVSELDFSNTVSIAGSVVPSITKRTHQTIAELKDGETLMIGGLMTQKISRINRKVPFFGDIPLIKFMFNGQEFSRTDIELLIVITPHIIKPINLGEQKTFYDEKTVREAVRVYEPIYQEPQSDQIGSLIVQNETRRPANEDEVGNFARSVAAKLDQAPSKPKSREKKEPKPANKSENKKDKKNKAETKSEPRSDDTLIRLGPSSSPSTRLSNRNYTHS